MLFNTVLWASDGRADEPHLVRYVAELCERYSSQLWIVHVAQTIWPEPAPQVELHGGEERAIAGLKARTRALRQQGINASLQVIRGVVGSLAPAIVQIAETVDADLMVVQSHEQRPFGPIGTAAQLLATAPCPLLLFGRRLTTSEDPPVPNGQSTAGRRPPHTHHNESRNRCLTVIHLTPLQSTADALRS